MELAINKHLSRVVAALCSHKAPVNEMNSAGEQYLWQALLLEDFDICDTLVGYLGGVLSY